MRLVCATLVVLIAIAAVYAGSTVVIMRPAGAAETGCHSDGSDAFSSDPFSGTPRWNKDINEDAIGITWDGTNNRLDCTTAGSGDYNSSTFTQYNVGSANQWAKVTLGFTGTCGTVSLQYGILSLRRDTSSGARYLLYMGLGSNCNINWGYWSGSGTSAPSLIGTSSACSFANGDVLGVKITGTGTSTAVSLWKNPSGATPDDWGSACATITNDPTTAVDTGNYIGVYCRATTSTSVQGFWDNMEVGHCH